MHELAPLVYDLAIMLGSAAIVVLLFQRIHQPIVLGYLVAGMIVGPYTPPHALVNDIENIKALSELGVIFLMFSLGLEFSFKKLARVGFSATVTGLVEVVLMIFVGYGVGLLLGWSHYDSIFLGAALSISSTTIIIKAIDELKLKSKRFAELVFGVLIVEDLLAILLLVALATLVTTKNIFSVDLIFAAIKLILVVGGWFLVGYFIVPPLFRKITDYISQETLTIISVALCLTLVSLAANLDYSPALGAFIMGSILAETTLVHRIEALILPIRDIFAAVFFISVGMLINPMVILNEWKIVLLLSLVTVVGKLFTTGIGALLTGQSLKTSTRVGFSMAQVGEFSFIIAALGVALQVTTDKLYPIIVAVSAITTFTTPYLIRFSGYLGPVLERRVPERTKYFLESYSAWVYRSLSSSNQKSMMRTVPIRLFINGLLIAIIFSLVHYLVFYRFGLFDKNKPIANVAFLLVSLGMASPFIWGMLFSYKAAKLPSYAETALNPAVFIVWLITLAELALLSIVYFHTWITVLVFFSIAFAFFVMAFKHLETSYNWFEQQLVTNLQNPENADRARYAELAPWDTHLVEIEVGEKSPFIGQTLREIHVRENFAINIVAISHGERVIAAPRGDEMIFAHDKLVVLGDDTQIDAFKSQLVMKATVQDPISFLDKFTLKSFLLGSQHHLVGKTIRHSALREYVNGMVVGLERDHARILNPNPDTILKADDLLLIVGEADKMQKLEWWSVE